MKNNRGCDILLSGEGIKKVSERILKDGRAIIVTEKDMSLYKWDEIPDGSKFIDTVTGIESVKLKGETDWIPAHVKNDGTICIAKDSMIVVEKFIVESIDLANKTFTYINENGDRRHSIIGSVEVDELSNANTYIDVFVFELEKEKYMKYRNHLEVIIDNVLQLNKANKKLVEISENRFGITEELIEGTEILVKYIRVFRIGNPYPRVFICVNEPEASEIGDLWIDYDDFIDTKELNDAVTESEKKINSITSNISTLNATISKAALDLSSALSKAKGTTLITTQTSP